ncbi:dienelactone hydrolase family protein [Tessaracoccus oleiagri]|uniref:Carboxymethylenebutenolidase n=1 Tax=Tessaracoccus oleiagri TaxID=686624 RepID=A0A1G9JCY8_9ACTN|nr:dienelactone hydrolase family protein [Tessaracoccus oleiagri]SDL35298.1 carboxymethylenebutenolidase [Tessaracoccus oleiagri]
MSIETTDDLATRWFGTTGAPLVVLLHDYMGRLPWLDEYAERVAAEGYHVAVPELHGGRRTTDPQKAVQLLRARYRDVPGALRIIDDTVRAGLAEGSPSVGLVGFSMGSALALEYAGTSDDVAGVVAHYGRPLHEDLEVRVPVLFQQGYDDVDDRGAPAERFRDRLLGIAEVEVYTYDARHGFANEQNAEKFDPAAAAAAWERTLGFLQAYVRV